MKIVCRCGNVIHDNLIPNPVGFLMIPELVVDELATDNKVPLDQLWMRSALGLRCENCGRLYIRWKRGDQGRQEFILVNPDGTISGYKDSARVERNE